MLIGEYLKLTGRKPGQLLFAGRGVGYAVETAPHAGQFLQQS
jgi:hypothetical protein